SGYGARRGHWSFRATTPARGRCGLGDMHLAILEDFHAQSATASREFVYVHTLRHQQTARRRRIHKQVSCGATSRKHATHFGIVNPNEARRHHELSPPKYSARRSQLTLDGIWKSRYNLQACTKH